MSSSFDDLFKSYAGLSSDQHLQTLKKNFGQEKNISSKAGSFKDNLVTPMIWGATNKRAPDINMYTQHPLKNVLLNPSVKNTFKSIPSQSGIIYILYIQPTSREAKDIRILAS